MRPRTIAQIVRVSPGDYQTQAGLAPDPAPDWSLAGPATPERQGALTVGLPAAGYPALDRLVTRAAERESRRSQLLVETAAPAGAQAAALPEPSVRPGSVVAPARELPVSAGPDPTAPAAAGPQPVPELTPPEARLLEEAELRRMLSRIIRTDALRYGLDLKER